MMPKPVTIQKGLPIPQKVGNPDVLRSLKQMEVGDSILVDGVGANHRDSRGYDSAQSYGKRSGKRFTGRKVEGGVRIWRIK